MRSGCVRAATAGLVAAMVVGGCEAPAHRPPPVGVSPPVTTSTAGVLDSVDPVDSVAAAPPADGPAPSGVEPAGAPPAAPRAAAGRARRNCLVERVHDGDTIRCKGGVSVRLLLIDAPELSQRPFGDQSRRALTRMVPVGARVTLETDREPRDRYGRLLAYVYAADGRMANAEMARAGYAVPLMYAPNGRYRAQVEAAASEAAAARRGLHATGGFACAPREHRRKRC